ncbi:MAG: DUF1345 domain-containing protein [Chitinophagaceae bacterium]
MPKKKISFWLNGIHTFSKIALSLVLGTMAVFLLQPLVREGLIRYLLGYCVFGLMLLGFYWISFYRTPIRHIQLEAEKEDSSRPVVFFLILLSIMGSVLAIVLILASRNDNSRTKLLHVGSAILGISIAWFLLHTIYTVKYAHLYYGDPNHEKGVGLTFPEGDGYMPDFKDFVYFSFVLGMTFQVSDISITSKKIRHVALWHSLISFVFNAVIIAVTINLIAGMGS